VKPLKPMDHHAKRNRRRERVLKTVAVLPSLATLGNLVCGLGAIYVCLLSVQAGGADLERQTLGSPRFNAVFPTYLAIAAYLLVGAMIFDGLDGRLARLTRKTSEFGGQLDSLSDIVSFGVAPAILVLCIVHPGDVAALGRWEKIYWRAEWVMAASYACCAALRLARFNVENEEDESAHLGFRGLPTPGAAWAIIGLIIFHQGLLPDLAGRSWAPRFVAALMPPFALVLGLLMASRFPYAHLVNALFRGRRTFKQVVALALVLLGGLIVEFHLTVAVTAAAYALSGPAIAGWRRARGTTAATPEALLEAIAPEGDDDESETFDDNGRDEADINTSAHRPERNTG